MIVTEAGVDLDGLEVRGDPVRYRVTFDETAVQPSAAVVAALSAVTDVDPVEMPPLYESVDPDALDALLEPPSGRARPVSVTIEIEGYEIEVTNDGVVIVDPPDDVLPAGVLDLEAYE